jgi:nifR3 family TIM-barrel protein
MKIGSFQPETNLLLCPIAGYCDLSFRLVIRSIGGLGLACTDLLSPHGLLKENDHSLQLAATCPDDKPLCMQLYGCQPGIMADAARWAEAHGANVIDINMGCPADKVVKRDGGVALMGNLPQAAAITQAVVNAVTIPVTVKMRLGCCEADRTAPRLARMVRDVGACAVTVHGRTGEQRFRGSVNHDGIAEVVAAVGDIPVIGNGDVKTPQDALRMIHQTGCAGVMIGRRALSDPWIFRDTHAYLTSGTIPDPPSVDERLAIVRQHFANMVNQYGERKACTTMRQRISWYARMLPNTNRLKQRMNAVSSPVEFGEIIEAYREQVSEVRHSLGLVHA